MKYFVLFISFQGCVNFCTQLYCALKLCITVICVYMCMWILRFTGCTFHTMQSFQSHTDNDAAMCRSVPIPGFYGGTDSNHFYVSASLLCHRVTARGPIRQWTLIFLPKCYHVAFHLGSNLGEKCVKKIFLKPWVTFYFGEKCSLQSLYTNQRLLLCPLSIRFITSVL